MVTLFPPARKKKKFLKFPVAYETNSQIMSLTRLGEEETVPWFIRME